MIVDVKSKASVIGHVNAKSSIIGTVASNTVLAGQLIGKIVVTHSDLPDYEGSYEATPAINEDRVFSTKDKSLRDDFIVHKIPYSEVENQGGGLTAVIGV